MLRSEMSGYQHEPFPINLVAEQTHQSDIDNSTNILNVANDNRRERTLANLRRRYRNRDAPSNNEPDLEEGKVSILPSVEAEGQKTEGNLSLDVTLKSETEMSSQRNLPLSITHRSNFIRTSDDRFREKFKNLIRSSAEGVSDAHLSDKMQTKTDDAMRDMTRSKCYDHPLPTETTHHSNFIRKPDDKLREKFKNLIRSPADGIPEVHVIGELSEGTGFKDTYVSCKWYLEWGKAWSFLAGDDAGQTQYSASDDHVNIWNHPIDVHFATASMQGWPRIIMQLWELDEYGRSILCGYGFAHFPTNPGYHELEVRCWRPSGSIMEEINSFFLGTLACLVDEKIIFGKAWETRSQLNTVSSGTVKMNVHILLRYFNEQKVLIYR